MIRIPKRRYHPSLDAKATVFMKPWFGIVIFRQNNIKTINLLKYFKSKFRKCKIDPAASSQEDGFQSSYSKFMNFLAKPQMKFAYKKFNKELKARIEFLFPI